MAEAQEVDVRFAGLSEMQAAAPCAALIEDIDNVFHGRENVARHRMGATLVLACYRARLRRWPAAILDPGCARRLDDVRPGRENGPSAEPENSLGGRGKPDLTISAIA